MFVFLLAAFGMVSVAFALWAKLRRVELGLEPAPSLGIARIKSGWPRTMSSRATGPV